MKERKEKEAKDLLIHGVKYFKSASRTLECKELTNKFLGLNPNTSETLELLGLLGHDDILQVVGKIKKDVVVNHYLSTRLGLYDAEKFIIGGMVDSIKPLDNEYLILRFVLG